MEDDTWVSGIYEISTYGEVRVASSWEDETAEIDVDMISVVEVDLGGRVLISLLGTLFWVDELVAITYLPNQNRYSIVKHKDEDLVNNHVDNLEWAVDTTLHESSCDFDYDLSDTCKESAVLSSIECTRKPVICVDTHTVYSSISECCRQLDIVHPTLVNCIRMHKRCKGLQFVFCNPVDQIETEATFLLKSHGLGCKNRRSRKVRCIETGQVFPSVTAASKVYQVSRSYVQQSLKSSCVHRLGVSFEYVD